MPSKRDGEFVIFSCGNIHRLSLAFAEEAGADAGALTAPEAACVDEAPFVDVDVAVLSLNVLLLLFSFSWLRKEEAEAAVDDGAVLKETIVELLLLFSLLVDVDAVRLVFRDVLEALVDIIIIY